jgi:hypothetical protein
MPILTHWRQKLPGMSSVGTAAKNGESLMILSMMTISALCLDLMSINWLSN